MKRFLALILALALCASLSDAATWYVEKDGSGDFLVIQDAVNAAASGDTILIGPGRYQDLTWYPDLNGANVAYWDDTRDLTFLGTSSAEVIIGPETYTPVGTGPAGITNNQDVVLRVENLSFANLKLGISSYYGEVHVADSKFLMGDSGLFIGDPRHLEVYNCSFQDFESFSVTTYRAEYAEVVDCELDYAVINFNDTATGIVRNCTVTGGSLVRYYLSQGLVEGCNARCDGNDPCISVSDSDTVRFYDNVILGGEPNMDVSGPGTNVFVERNDFSWPDFANFYFHNFASVYAHDNHINRSSSLIDYIIYTTTYTDVYPSTIDMGSNYWFDDGTPARLDSLIHDGNDDPALHIFVNYDPIRTEPVATEKKSLGGLKALFR